MINQATVEVSVTLVLAIVNPEELRIPVISKSPIVPPGVWSVKKIKSPVLTYVFATLTLPLEPRTAVPQELLVPDLILRLAIEVMAPLPVRSIVPKESAIVLAAERYQPKLA